MNDFIRNRLDAAHALIDEGTIPYYQTAVETIKNLKIRIHDTDLLTKINMHDSEVEKEYNQRYQNIGIRGGDPYQVGRDVHDLEKWRAQEYLKYYDLLLKENDA